MRALYALATALVAAGMPVAAAAGGIDALDAQPRGPVDRAELRERYHAATYEPAQRTRRRGFPPPELVEAEDSGDLGRVAPAALQAVRRR